MIVESVVLRKASGAPVLAVLPSGMRPITAAIAAATVDADAGHNGRLVAVLALATISMTGSSLILHGAGGAEASGLTRPAVGRLSGSHNVQDGPWGTGPDPCGPDRTFVSGSGGFFVCQSTAPPTTFTPNDCQGVMRPVFVAGEFIGCAVQLDLIGVPTSPTGQPSGNQTRAPGATGQRSTGPTTRVVDSDGDLFSVTVNVSNGSSNPNSAFGITELNDASQGLGQAGMDHLTEAFTARGMTIAALNADQQTLIRDIGFTVNPTDWANTLKFVGVDLFAVPETTTTTAPTTTTSATTTSPPTTDDSPGTTSSTGEVSSNESSSKSNQTLVVMVGAVTVPVAAGVSGLWLLGKKRRRRNGDQTAPT